MELYTLVLLKSGEEWNPSAPGFMDVMKQHHAFVKEMTEKAKIAEAGPFPFGDPGELRGITIYRSGAEETAKIVQDDPIVKAELLKIEMQREANLIARIRGRATRLTLRTSLSEK